jgi:hypothetical protein
MRISELVFRVMRNLNLYSGNKVLERVSKLKEAKDIVREKTTGDAGGVYYSINSTNP